MRFMEGITSYWLGYAAGRVRTQKSEPHFMGLEKVPNINVQIPKSFAFDNIKCVIPPTDPMPFHRFFVVYAEILMNSALTVQNRLLAGLCSISDHHLDCNTWYWNLIITSLVSFPRGIRANQYEEWLIASVVRIIRPN